MSGDRAVLSVDLELFGHTPAYRSADGELPDTNLGLEGVEYLLNAFEDRGIDSTFFAVSTIAESNPAMMRRIANEGHEVASHTHTHTRLPSLTAAERGNELKRSREILTRVTSTEVDGFRAPVFDLSADHFEAVHRAGYSYDSSVISTRRLPGFYSGEYSASRPCSAACVEPNAPQELRELPVAVMPGLRLPLSGAWLRFFGTGYALSGMRLLARKGIVPVLYIHPWELVDLPAVPGVPRRVYVRTGAWMRRAVGRLLDGPFEFTTAASVAGG